MKKDGYTLNLIHLAVKTDNLELVRYLIEELKMKLSLALPHFNG
jgi:hypothetical protein